jgi:hypothetical protein
MGLALGIGSIYEEAVYKSVGLKRGSIRFSVEALEGRGEVMRTEAGPVLADPLFEYWLQDRGVL